MLLNEMNSNANKLKKISRFLKESYDYDLNLDALTHKKARAMIAHTTSKIAQLKENNASRTEIDRLTLVKESLRLWTVSTVQSELTQPVLEGLDDADVEEAKVILAAQELSDRLQKMVEDIAQMQVQDLMPIIDAMKADIGTAEAEQFNVSVEGALSNLLDAAKTAKDDVSNAILAAQGQAPTDMDGGMGDDMGGAPDIDMDMGDEEMVDDEFGGDEAMAGGDENPLGREMKGESLAVFDQMLEDIQSKVVEGKVSVSAVQDALKKFRSGQ